LLLLDVLKQLNITVGRIMCIVFLFTISKCLDTFEHVIMVKLPNIRSKFGQLINYLLKNIYIYKKTA